MKALHYIWSIPVAILLGALAGIFIAATTIVCGILILRDIIFPRRTTNQQLKNGR